MKQNKKSMALTVVLTAILALVAARPCAATTWTVETTADDGGPNTLRGVLASAQAGDTINITATGTILLNPDYATGGPLVVDKSVTIIGPGQENLTIDGGYHVVAMNQVAPTNEVAPMNGSAPTGVPVFWVGFNSGVVIPSVTVRISGLTVAHGAHQGGGGILNGGSLTLSHCTLHDNIAEYGGAIANLGTLTLEDCTLNNNAAFFFGGAIFNGNLISSESPSLTVTRCILTDNMVTSVGWLCGGGAIANVAYAATATLSVEDSTLAGNSAQAGGAIYNSSSGDSYSLPAVPGFAVASIVRSTLSGNSAAVDASMALGGAICQTSSVPGYANLTVECSTLSGNFATSPVFSTGGAICNYSLSFGSVVVTNSTLANNSAAFTDGADPTQTQAAIGGGVFSSGGTLTVDNCTLSGNVDAGALSVLPRASGILVGDGANLTIKNTILANDASGPNLMAAPATESTSAGTVTNLGYNVCTDDGSGLLVATGDLINTNPLLGPLADNGGPTWTCALLSGSPAIDAANSLDSAGTTVTQDQRGVSRPQGLANDVGAFEVVPATSALDISGATATSPSQKSPNITVTVTITNPKNATAYDVTVTAATLGGTDSKSPLPLVFGAIKPGATKKCTLQFKTVPSGEQTLTVNGTSSLGVFLTTQIVNVP